MSDPPRFNPPLRVPTLTEVVQESLAHAPTHAPNHTPIHAPDRLPFRLHDDISITEPRLPATSAAEPVALPLPLRQASVPDLATDFVAPLPIDEAHVTQRVLHDVQRQIDLMLEYRLREALAPVLARLGDSLIRDARDELASTLRDVVARAVAQELARHRGR